MSGVTLISLTASLFLVIKQKKTGTCGNNIVIVKVFESLQIFCMVLFRIIYQNESFSSIHSLSWKFSLTYFFHILFNVSLCVEMVAVLSGNGDVLYTAMSLEFSSEILKCFTSQVAEWINKAINNKAYCSNLFVIFLQDDCDFAVVNRCCLYWMNKFSTWRHFCWAVTQILTIRQP